MSLESLSDLQKRQLQPPLVSQSKPEQEKVHLTNFSLMPECVRIPTHSSANSGQKLNKISRKNDINPAPKPMHHLMVEDVTKDSSSEISVQYLEEQQYLNENQGLSKTKMLTLRQGHSASEPQRTKCFRTNDCRTLQFSVPLYCDKSMEMCAMDKNQKVPLPTLYPGDVIKYACAKQAQRIHKLRVKRLLGRLPVHRVPILDKVLYPLHQRYRYEKRSIHAQKRLRAENGQFYSKDKHDKILERNNEENEESTELLMCHLRTMEVKEEPGDELDLPPLLKDLSDFFAPTPGNLSRQNSFLLF